MVLEQRKRTLYYRAPPPPAMVLGTGGLDILFYFWDQANNVTSIPCEGIITDLPNSVSLFSIGIVCSFGRTFGASVDTCSLCELQYQRDMFICSYFPQMCLYTCMYKCTLVSLRTISFFPWSSTP